MKLLAALALLAMSTWRTGTLACPDAPDDRQECLSSTAAQEKPEDSALVKAAKAAGGKRKSTTKVITNSDVKKAAAKKPLTVPAGKPSAAAAAPQGANAKSAQQTEDERYHGRLGATKRAGDAETHVAQLEAEMRRLELAYYSESDLDYRDTALVPRFNQVKKQLDDARKELADARDALSKLQ